MLLAVVVLRLFAGDTALPQAQGSLRVVVGHLEGADGLFDALDHRAVYDPFYLENAIGYGIADGGDCQFINNGQVVIDFAGHRYHIVCDGVVEFLPVAP